MSVYTRVGDNGNTYLIGNTKVSKDSPIFDVLGTMDEFNASLGIVLSDIPFSPDAKEFLITIQGDLFKLGALVANPKAKEADFSWLSSRVKTIEEYIDELDQKLPDLRSFILPGGTPGAARLHLSRTVCRRLERNCARYYQDGNVGKKNLLKFINRLSDLLFVLARYLNFNENVKDIIWNSSDE